MIEAFRAGFEQGAQTADSDVEVVSRLLHATTDPVGYDQAILARDVATEMYEDGVDVIFVAAGGSGLGVIEAATRLTTSVRPLWAIGVDSDQYFDISSDDQAHLLTSMYKRLEAGIGTVVGAHRDGTLTGQRTLVVGAAEGAVGYTETGDHLDPETVVKLEEFRDRIVDGTLVVDQVPAMPWDLEVDVQLALVDVDSGSVSPLARLPESIDDFAVSPDGTRMASGGCCFVDDRITVTDLDGGNPDTLTPTPGRSQYGAAWSPDGAQLVVQERLSIGLNAGSLLVVDLDTGATTTIADFEDAERGWWWMAPAFSSDGERVVFHLAVDAGEDTAFDVWSVPVTGGQPERVITDAAFPVPLADGSIAVVSGRRGLFDERSATISIVDPHGERRELIDVVGGVWQPRGSPDGTRLAFVQADPDGQGGQIGILDVTTGETTITAKGDVVDWFDDDTLVVATFGP